MTYFLRLFFLIAEDWEQNFETLSVPGSMNWKGPVAAITAERLDEVAEGLCWESLCVVAPPAENIWPEAMSHLLMKKSF